MHRTILAQNVSYERLVLDWLQDDAQDDLATQKAKGKGRGWWGPPKGSHGAGSTSRGDYRSFEDWEEAVGWLESQPDITPDTTRLEFDSIASYKGSGYNEINVGLRKGEARETTKQTIRNIDSVMERTKIPENVVAFRSIGTGSVLGERKTRDATGMVFRDKGYGSTTLDVKEASGQAYRRTSILAEIRIPKGYRGIYIEGIYNKHRVGMREEEKIGERELLLPRGTRYRVINDNFASLGSGKKRHIVLEVVP